MICLVMNFTGCCKWKQAENYWDFLIHAGKFPDLKRGGCCTVSAQKTTTKRSQIKIEQQLCWNGIIESAVKHLMVSVERRGLL